MENAKHIIKKTCSMLKSEKREKVHFLFIIFQHTAAEEKKISLFLGSVKWVVQTSPPKNLGQASGKLR